MFLVHTYQTKEDGMKWADKQYAYGIIGTFTISSEDLGYFE